MKPTSAFQFQGHAWEWHAESDCDLETYQANSFEEHLDVWYNMNGMTDTERLDFLEQYSYTVKDKIDVLYWWVPVNGTGPYPTLRAAIDACATRINSQPAVPADLGVAPQD